MLTRGNNDAMKRDEMFVRDYLLHRGFPSEGIVYEPLGTDTTPDFLVLGEIAIEARRLNQYHNVDGAEVPGEQLAAAIHRRLEKILAEFGPARHGCTWFVHYRFRRPLSSRCWEPMAREKLMPFARGEITISESSILVDENLNLTLLRRTDVDGNYLEIGGMSDLDQGGFIVPLLEKSLALAINEKAGKTAQVRAQKPEWKWWLVLVDHINGGACAGVRAPHDFDKVIVVCPGFFPNAYEVGKSEATQD